MPCDPEGLAKEPQFVGCLDDAAARPGPEKNKQNLLYPEEFRGKGVSLC